ncbi:MAG: hypothetical protein AABW79_00700 [Nanoarchaeota archaeon]
MTSFSNRKGWETYSKWKRSHSKTGHYVKRIIRLHKLFPKATLKELRILKFATIDLSRKPWNFLTSYERDLRIKALYVVSDIIKGKKIELSLFENNITLQDLLIHAGKTLFRKGDSWFGRKDNRIQRERWFYSNGKTVYVIIDNSHYASLISKYLYAVKESIRTGDESFLKPFKYKKIKDVYGRKYSFETNLKKLYELDEMYEREGDRPIYGR